MRTFNKQFNGRLETIAARQTIAHKDEQVINVASSASTYYLNVAKNAKNSGHGDGFGHREAGWESQKRDQDASIVVLASSLFF